MKKVMTVVTIMLWIVAVIAAVVLICHYKKDIMRYLLILKDKLASKCTCKGKQEDIFEE